MTEWKFDQHEVLEDNEGRWWHIVDRWVNVDGNKRKYELADATHTEYKTLHAGDVEGFPSEAPMFDTTGWETTTKPAAENGFRVNGVLCGPQAIEFWRDNDCIHEETCSDCGADGKGEIDIIHDIENQEVQSSHYLCRECGNQWVDND
jgi:hypothetical protein